MSTPIVTIGGKEVRPGTGSQIERPALPSVTLAEVSGDTVGSPDHGFNHRLPLLLGVAFGLLLAFMLAWAVRRRQSR